MADKVQKIREEVERLRKSYQIMYQELDGESPELMSVCAKRNLCQDVLMFIDSLQEEPVSEDLEKAAKEWLRPQLDKSYANYGEVKMMELTHFDGYAMLDAIEFGAEWQKIKDESTTENLGEYINELSKQFPEMSFAKLSRIAVRVAKWQKQKDQSTIELAEDHAMLAGMNKMEEEMMKNLWKPADSDDLPEYDREVIVLTQSYPLENSEYAVSFAHRPNPDGWDGKSLTSGKVEHYTPKTYDKGGWNIPDVRFWLDVKLPKEIEL